MQLVNAISFKGGIFRKNFDGHEAHRGRLSLRRQSAEPSSTRVAMRDRDRPPLRTSVRGVSGGVYVEDGARECLGGLLRQIVADAAAQGSMRVGA